MEKKLPTNVENKNKELERLMKKTAETKEGLVFYSEKPLFNDSDKEQNRKMAVDFIESKLFNYEKKKTEEEQNNDLQLLNAFFEEEIGYLNQDNLTITANELKDTFISFLRNGREIDLTYQELTLFVNIIDDVQVLMEDEKSGKKNANSINRLNKMEQNNPK